MTQIVRQVIDQQSGVGHMVWDGGNPDGILAAPKGMVLFDKSGPGVYQNQDGATTWALLGGSGSTDSVRIVGGEGNQPQIAVVELDSAALATGLNDLIAAPGADLVVFPHHVAAWFDAQTTPYDVGGVCKVVYAGAPSFGDDIFENNSFDFTSGKSQFGYFTQTNSPYRLVSETANQALQLLTDAMSLGDGKLYVIVVYSIVRLSTGALIGGDSGDSPIPIVREFTATELATADVDFPVLFPAPGAGKIAVLVNSFSLAKATTAFADSGHYLNYENDISGYISVAGTNLAREIDNFSTNTFDYQLTKDVDTEDFRNKALVFQAYPSAITGGVGTLTYAAWYYVFDTVTKTITSGRGSGMRYRSAKLDKAQLREMTSSQIKRPLIDAPGASELLMLLSSGSHYVFNSADFPNEGLFLFQRSGNLENDYAAYIEPQTNSGEDSMSFGVADYANAIDKADLQGAGMVASAANDLSGSGDGSVDFWMWCAVLAA